MGTRKSIMKHQFSQIPRADIPRSSFNRSHGYKTTFDSGFLVPFYADEALPGDTFNAHATIFARLATPIAPIMDNMYLDTFYFAVPIRLIWDNWERFNGEQANPSDSTDFLVPQVKSPTGGWTVGSLEESEHKLKHQLYVFAKQLKRVDVLLNKDIDYIITDSPTLLSYFYGEKFQVNLEGFKELVVSSFKSTPQINVFLRRTLPFDETLRLQTSEESDNDSEVLERILNELNVPYTTF